MGSVGGKLSTVAVATLLALFAVSCGGDDDATTGETTTAAQGEGSDGAGQGGGKASKQPSGGSGSQGDSGSAAPAKQHDDSGGGSAQFRIKGGDNSVQEFGEEATGQEFDQAAEAVHGFFDSRVRGDWGAACSYMAADVAASLQQLAGKSEELEGASCAKTLEAISAGVPQSAFREAAKADIGSLRVEGDQAFVIYRGAMNTIFAIPVKSEDGTWKVASLAGTPLN